MWETLAARELCGKEEPFCLQMHFWHSCCCHHSAMGCFSLSRRHIGEDMAVINPSSVFQVLFFLSAHSRKAMISPLGPQSGAAPWTRSLCPPSGLSLPCLAPLSEAGASSRGGEIPQNKASSFPVPLELVAGAVTLARCLVALVGRQLQWAPSARHSSLLQQHTGAWAQTWALCPLTLSLCSPQACPGRVWRPRGIGSWG